MRDMRLLILIAMLGAAAFILMATVQIPLLPAAPYLKYDPSDVVALLAAFLMGPPAGAAVVAVKDVLFFLFRASSVFGPLANFIAVGTFVGVAGLVFRRRRLRSLGWLTAACGAGAVARIVIMVPANFVILYLEFGLPPARVAPLLWPAIIPFNGAASVINAAVTIAIVAALQRRGALRLLAADTR